MVSVHTMQPIAAELSKNIHDIFLQLQHSIVYSKSGACTSKQYNCLKHAMTNANSRIEGKGYTGFEAV